MLSWLTQQASAFAEGPAPIATIKVRFRSALGPAETARVEAVVADVASNSLLISASPRQFEQLERIIRDID